MTKHVIVNRTVTITGRIAMLRSDASKRQSTMI